MSPGFRSLLWKEWIERQRLFRFGVGILVLYLGYCTAYELEFRTRAFVASYYGTCTMFAWFASVLLAMTTATGEYSQGTLRFSRSLPVSLRQIAWTRLLGAWGFVAGIFVIGALLVTPLLATGVFEQAGLRMDHNDASVRLPDRESISQLEAVGFLWTTAAIGVVAAVFLVTLISLLGTCCRTEGTVGFLGAIIVLILGTLTAIRYTLKSAGLEELSKWIGGLLPGSMAINWGYGDLDGSSYTDLELPPLILGPMLISCLVSLGLGELFARRYGRRVEAQGHRPAKKWQLIPAGPQLAARLGLRWPGCWAALMWLNARQSVPMCFAGLALAVLITFVGMTESASPVGVASRLAGDLPSSTWFVGLLWGAVVAVGLFAPELKPEHEHFWRSRPIFPGNWFWMKFGVGLFALLATLDVIPALLTLSTPYRPDTGRIGVAYAACIPLLHTLIYALAVAAVCKLRRPIPAAIIALVLFFAIDQIMESVPVYPKLSTMNVYNQLDSIEFPRDPTVGATGEPVDLLGNGYPLVYGLVGVIIVFSTIFARRCVTSPVTSGRRWLAVGIGVWCVWGTPAAHAAESPNVSEIVEAIRAREDSIHNLHLRFSLKTLRTGNETAAAPSQEPHEDEKVFDYYDRPPLRAWTEADAAGVMTSKTVYDGTTRMDFQSRVRHNGSITKEPEGPPTLHYGPEPLLMLDGIPLADLFLQVPDATITRRTEEGQELIDWKGNRTVTFQVDGRHVSYSHRYFATLNVSRGYWPVRLEREVGETSSDQPTSRMVTSVKAWTDAGPIAFPKVIELESFLTDPNDPGKLVHALTQHCEVSLVEINGEIHDSSFDKPFPPGAVFYDFRDRRWYEVDADGQMQVYQPKPRGIRGAVLVYHLIWITAGCVYLWRTSTHESTA